MDRVSFIYQFFSVNVMTQPCWGSLYASPDSVWEGLWQDLNTSNAQRLS